MSLFHAFSIIHKQQLWCRGYLDLSLSDHQSLSSLLQCGSEFRSFLHLQLSTSFLGTPLTTCLFFTSSFPTTTTHFLSWILISCHYMHSQDTLSSLTSGLVDLALGGMLCEGAWFAKGPWEGGTAWTPGLHGPSTSLRFLLLEKCLKETGHSALIKWDCVTNWLHKKRN